MLSQDIIEKLTTLFCAFLEQTVIEFLPHLRQKTKKLHAMFMARIIFLSIQLFSSHCYLALNENYKLLNYIVSCQFLNIYDEKISKSKDNGITVRDLLNEYSSDSIRYCVTYQAPELNDTNHSRTTA